MIKKVLPLMILGMAAQDYYNKSGKKKDSKKDKEMEKAVAKKKLDKTNKKYKEK